MQVYLRPWDAYVAAGGRGMMLSHNTIDGIQMHANHEIMTEHFREARGYEGFFASDLGKPTVSLSDPLGLRIPLPRPFPIRLVPGGTSSREATECLGGCWHWCAGNIEAIWQNANVAANYSDAIALSLWAGMDQSFDSPGNGFDTSKLRPAIDSGEVRHF